MDSKEVMAILIILFIKKVQIGLYYFKKTSFYNEMVICFAYMCMPDRAIL